MGALLVSNFTTQTPKDLGKKGEEIAACFFESQGCKILARNHRIGRLEVDLILQDQDCLVFVEVKTRKGGLEDSLMAVDRKKQSHIREAAEKYCLENGWELQPRFDVVSIHYTYGKWNLEHFPNSFTIFD